MGDCDVLVDQNGNELPGQTFDENGRCVNESEVLSRAANSGQAPAAQQPQAYGQGYGYPQPYAQQGYPAPYGGPDPYQNPYGAPAYPGYGGYPPNPYGQGGYPPYNGGY